jgi:uncharacterized membrane protein YgcG
MKRLYTAETLALACLLFSAQASFAQDEPQPPAEPPQAAQQSPEQLQQLVAPIALYPDSLIAQILPAATYPDQILEAAKFLDQNKGVAGQQLAPQVDTQPWDPSVKALTGFPSVLGNMRQNLAWTSELGDAYVNQPQDVNMAIQTMRQRAQQAGTLKSTPQQVVNTQGPDIAIQPAAPDTVYVPEYDPWLAYGPPLAPWPGWYPYPGLYLDGPGFAFGIGFPIGFYGGYGWGWNNWRYNWRGGGRVEFGRRPYISHSNVIVNRGGFRGGAARNFDGGRSGFRGGAPNGRAGANLARPAPNVRPNEGMRSGAFSGVRAGGDMRGTANRGRTSFGGGGAARGGGGGSRGGGGRR